MRLDPLLQELLPSFAVEAEEIAQSLQAGLVELEREISVDDRRKIYDGLARGLHTLKGTSATLGLEHLAELAHQMEDLLSPFRKELSRMPAELADALLRGADLFILNTKAYATGQDDELPPLPTLLTLHQLETLPDSRAASEAEPTLLEIHGAQSAQPVGLPPPPVAETPVESEVLQTSATSVPVEFEGSWRVNTGEVLSLMREVERLRELRLRLDDRRRDLEHTVNLIASEREAAGQGDGSPNRIRSADLRASVGSVIRALRDDGQEAEDVVATLEEGLKSISTLPLRTVLDPLQRTVRDLCRRSRKEARLSVVGGEISLDRRLLESLRAPLIHLVRNAVDHGIEIPQARRARGKHSEGAIVIRIEQRGNLVFIEIEDDGNGLDDQRIREEAVRSGLRSQAEIAVLLPNELHQLIFHPGFTTQAQVTATSGRGFGLDVVRRQVATLNGTLEVQSRPGQGTRFMLSVVAELGSSPVLMVRCAEQLFGIPLSSVESLLTAQQALLRVGRKRIQVEHRGQVMQVSDLGVLLGLRPLGMVEEGKPLMVLRSKGQQLALAVDEVLGDRDLVIRPLPPELRALPAYQGAAVLAQGQLMLIVRSEWLTDPERLLTTITSAGHRALVVDDSLTARALHRAALESGGFLVHTASSGQQALEQLATGSYDVVVADVMMMGMDGLAFTRKLRSRPETRNVPVVLVSARDADSDRARGMAAGADAFLSKKDCASGRLLTEVSSVMSRIRRQA
jgi:two-component system chemotaxis sensor kinase CheA